MIELYTAATPNGQKISIALEEMQLPYKIRDIDLSSGWQKSNEYLKICPNGRIPAIIDQENGNRAIFESGAILLYLAEKTGLFLPVDADDRLTVYEWLMFQMSAIGPMMGQAVVFNTYFPIKLDGAIDRFENEVRRLFDVVNRRLEKVEYIAGAYSIADMAAFPWMKHFELTNTNLEDYKNVERWLEANEKRPATKAGLAVPEVISDAERVRRAKSMVTK